MFTRIRTGEGRSVPGNGGSRNQRKNTENDRDGNLFINSFYSVLGLFSYYSVTYEHVLLVDDKRIGIHESAK